MFDKDLVLFWLIFQRKMLNKYQADFPKKNAE
jgi:hypothetical protein